MRCSFLTRFNSYSFDSIQIAFIRTWGVLFWFNLNCALNNMRYSLSIWFNSYSFDSIRMALITTWGVLFWFNLNHTHNNKEVCSFYSIRFILFWFKSNHTHNNMRCLIQWTSTVCSNKLREVTLCILYGTHDVKRYFLVCYDIIKILNNIWSNLRMFKIYFHISILRVLFMFK
jgi:hypothetical protein